MPKRMLRVIATLSSTSALLILLQGCVPATTDTSVSEAYRSSETVAVQPYTRSIFSTNNF